MIDNTTKKINENPSLFLMQAMIAGTSGAIEAQEAQGQAQLVNSELLPSACDTNSRQALTTAGVIFGEVVEGDDMFCHVTLPVGWKKVRTDHSMWSKVLDERGRERASIFYKAAFYDRKAHMSATRRYSCETVYENGDYSLDKKRPVNILDAGKVIHTIPAGEYNAANNAAEAWLNEQFPDWRDVGAYWIEEDKR